MANIFEKEHELLQLLYQNTNLQGICNKIEELIGNPIGVGDFFWNKVVMSRSYPMEEVQDLIRRLEHLPGNSRERSMENMFFWLQDRKPRLVELPYLRNCRMVCGIFYQDRLVAHLEAPEVDSSFGQLDLELFKICADIMGLALHFNGFPTDQATRHPYILLWNYFNQAAEQKYTEDWNHCPDFKLIDQFVLLWLESTPESEGFLRAVDCFSARHWNIPLQSGTLCLFDAGSQALLDSLHTAAADGGLLVGVSDLFTGLNELNEALRQAKSSLTFARRAGKSCGAAFYNSCKLQDLFWQAGEQLALQRFCDHTLLHIRSWDQEHQTEYERTLRTYLLNGQSILTTASLLFIHKNTVIYRINKLKEQFQIDFNDCRQISQLYCSFLIDDLPLRASTPPSASAAL